LFQKSFHAQSVVSGAAARTASAQRRQLLKTWYWIARAATLLGLVLAVGGIAFGARAFDFNTLSIVIGIGLLALGAFYSFPQSRRIERAIVRGLRSGGRVEATKLEEIKDAHWELADRASHYRELLDAQQDFVVRRSFDGHLVFANSAFCDAFDVGCDDILGSIFQPPVILEESETELSSRGRRVVQLLRTRKGKRWIAWDVCEVKNDHGETEIQSVGRDVTVERAIASELKNARDQAEAASRAKSRFLAAMSHEIRTPMNGILGMISLMRDTPLDGEQRACVGIVEDSARALLVLIDDILDFSKIEAGKLDLADKVFSLKSCIAQASQLLAPEAAAKRLTFASTIDDGVPDWVHGDEMRVRQIVLNLLSNAVKFTDKGGVAVRVSMAEEQHTAAGTAKIAIKVTDTGVGFSPEFMLRLFTEFEQSETSPSRHPGGTGLGLAISKRLAHAMGGDIIADASLERGASFTAVLNFEVADGAAKEKPLSDLATARSVVGSAGVECRRHVASGFNVLIAEDNRINALLARKIVERAGGRATIVDDGRLAIAAVWETMRHRQPAFDLILMDVMMPGVDGLMAAKSIKELFRERQQSGLVCPPIIALTANAFPEDRERCCAVGMDDYLAKPFEAQQLHDVLLRWVPERAEKTPPAA
jgi:signal transduction histidine kinase